MMISKTKDVRFSRKNKYFTIHKWKIQDLRHGLRLLLDRFFSHITTEVPWGSDPLLSVISVLTRLVYKVVLFHNRWRILGPRQHSRLLCRYLYLRIWDVTTTSVRTFIYVLTGTYLRSVRSYNPLEQECTTVGTYLLCWPKRLRQSMKPGLRPL